MQRMYGTRQETILDDYITENDDCYLCGEHYDECQCCTECENHVDECTCGEGDEELMFFRDDVSLNALAAVHTRLRAPQPDCDCPYCTGYRAGEGDE